MAFVAFHCEQINISKDKHNDAIKYSLLFVGGLCEFDNFNNFYNNIEHAANYLTQLGYDDNNVKILFYGDCSPMWEKSGLVKESKKYNINGFNPDKISKGGNSFIGFGILACVSASKSVRVGFRSSQSRERELLLKFPSQFRATLMHQSFFPTRYCSY